jgi:CheY-like chemotaxis protein
VDVLLVEDDPGVRMFVKLALKKAGIPYRVAVHGGQALALAAEAWPGVVLLDLSLPGGLDGWAVWDRMRDQADTRSLKVYVLSGDIDPALEEEVRQRGGVGVLRKPVHPETLVECIRRASA